MKTFEVEGLLTIQVKYQVEGENLKEAQKNAKLELIDHYSLDSDYDTYRDAKGAIIFDIAVEPLE